MVHCPPMAKTSSLGFILGVAAFGVGGYFLLQSRPAKAASGAKLPPNVLVLENLTQAMAYKATAASATAVGVVTDESHRLMIERIIFAHAAEHPDIQYVIVKKAVVEAAAKMVGGVSPSHDGWGGVVAVVDGVEKMHRAYDGSHTEEYVENTITTADGVLLEGPDPIEGLVPGNGAFSVLLP